MNQQKKTTSKRNRGKSNGGGNWAERLDKVDAKDFTLTMAYLHSLSMVLGMVLPPNINERDAVKTIKSLIGVYGNTVDPEMPTSYNNLLALYCRAIGKTQEESVKTVAAVQEIMPTTSSPNLAIPMGAGGVVPTADAIVKNSENYGVNHKEGVWKNFTQVLTGGLAKVGVNTLDLFADLGVKWAAKKLGYDSADPSQP